MKNVNPNQQFPGYLSIGLVIMGWQLFLIYLFVFSGAILALTLVLGLIFTVAGVWLARYFANRKHRLAGWTLVIFCSFYLQLITLPNDGYDSRPVNEFRTAVSLLVNSQQVTPDILIRRHEPPYAIVTAALHKYREELPEHSWLISFDNDEKNYLFNIRNNLAGHNHPGVLHAELTNEFLMIQVEHSRLLVTYSIPLNKTPTAFRIEGKASLPTPAGTYQATVYPHLLQVDNHSRFQQYFYSILNYIHS